MSHVKVCCRIRPLEGDAAEAVTMTSPQTVSVDALPFQLDRVFNSQATQLEVYTSAAEPLIADLFQGLNCTLFTYGQTGSGKTFTMQGGSSGSGGGSNSDCSGIENSSDDRLKGIIPRVSEAIFQCCQSQTSTDIQYTVSLSLMEIYQEKIFDLLVPTSTSNTKAAATPLRIRESAGGSVWVQGLVETVVTSVEEFRSSLDLGLKRRATGSHSMNAQSSRSHFCCVIFLVQDNKVVGVRKRSKFHLIDLAGSEMVRKTDATGVRLAEAKHINKSLSALGNVIKALTTKPGVPVTTSTSTSISASTSTEHPQLNSTLGVTSSGSSAVHIPFRDSKLTRVLQDSLSGNSRIVLLLTVSSLKQHAAEAVSTLRFGERARHLCTRPRVNTELDERALRLALAEAQEKIALLTATVLELQALGETSEGTVGGRNGGSGNGDAVLCAICRGDVRAPVKTAASPTSTTSTPQQVSVLAPVPVPIPSPVLSPSVTVLTSSSPSTPSAAVIAKDDSGATDCKPVKVKSTASKKLPKNHSQATGRSSKTVKSACSSSAATAAITTKPRTASRRDRPVVAVEESSASVLDFSADDEAADDDGPSRCAVCGLDDEETAKLLLDTCERLGEMFLCDGNCGQRFHVRCVGLVGEGGQYSLPDGEWLCSACSIGACDLAVSSSSSSSLSLSSPVSVPTVVSDEDEEVVGTGHDLLGSPAVDKLSARAWSVKLATIKGEYHVMRRERNRIMAQWQQEQAVQVLVNKKRAEMDKDREEQMVALMEKVEKLQTELDWKCAEERRLIRLSQENVSLSSSNRGGQTHSLSVTSVDDDSSEKNLPLMSSSASAITLLNQLASTAGGVTGATGCSETSSIPKPWLRKKAGTGTSTASSDNRDKRGSSSVTGGSVKLPAISSSLNQIDVCRPSSQHSLSSPARCDSPLSSRSKTDSHRHGRAANGDNDSDEKGQQAKEAARDAYNYSQPSPSRIRNSDLEQEQHQHSMDSSALSSEDPMDEYSATKFLAPIHSRLQSLLRAVKDETGSYAEIRMKHREREGERSMLKSRAGRVGGSANGLLVLNT